MQHWRNTEFVYLIFVLNPFKYVIFQVRLRLLQCGECDNSMSHITKIQKFKNFTRKHKMKHEVEKL